MQPSVVQGGQYNSIIVFVVFSSHFRSFVSVNPLVFVRVLVFPYQARSTIMGRNIKTVENFTIKAERSLYSVQGGMFCIFLFIFIFFMSSLVLKRV